MNSKIIIIFITILFIPFSVLSRSIDSELIEAVTRRDITAVKFLIKKGANVNATLEHFGGFGLTPLILAAGNADNSIVKILIENGANINGQSRSGETALITAAGQGHTETVIVLINMGADVNLRSAYDGWTALMWAVTNRHLRTVNILLEKGADVNIENKLGVTALSMAKASGNEDIIKLLQKYGSKENVKGFSIPTKEHFRWKLIIVQKDEAIWIDRENLSDSFCLIKFVPQDIKKKKNYQAFLRRKGKEFKDFAYLHQLYQLDFINNKIKIISAEYINKDNKIIYSEKYPNSDWDNIRPNTIGEQIKNAVYNLFK